MSDFNHDQLQDAVDDVNHQLHLLSDSIVEAFALLARSEAMAAFSKEIGEAVDQITRLNELIWNPSHKLPAETWSEFVKRRPEMLDDPDVRWEYTKELWGMPIRLIKNIWNKVK